MARPLRIEFPGALYHVTSRGDGREDIYRADGDRRMFLSVLTEVCERFNWWGHAFCLMTNHCRLLMEAPDGNLSEGMRQLNGVYTQRFNDRHGRCRHVFPGAVQGGHRAGGRPFERARSVCRTDPCSWTDGRGSRGLRAMVKTGV